MIYPTDTVYALGCDMMQPKAIQKMARMKGYKSEKAPFSIIGSSISQLSEYVRLDNEQKKIGNKRKEIGVRIPNNSITLSIVEALGNPLVTTSIRDDDEVIEYTTDPELIYEKYQKYQKQVEMVLDGGYGQNVASTIVDCTKEPFEIVRQGIGELK